MEKTSTTSDGTKIIYSDAHQALDAYNEATKRAKDAGSAVVALVAIAGGVAWAVILAL